jgi:hypothetical protein
MTYPRLLLQDQIQFKGFAVLRLLTYDVGDEGLRNEVRDEGSHVMYIYPEPLFVKGKKI